MLYRIFIEFERSTRYILKVSSPIQLISVISKIQKTRILCPFFIFQLFIGKQINMLHPNFKPTLQPDNSVFIELCEELCPKCLNGINKLNKIKIDDWTEKMDSNLPIIEFTFSITPTEDFIGLQNFSGVEDLIYLLFSKYSKKEQGAIKKSTIYLLTMLENSNYYHYPLVKMKLLIQGNWSEQMIEKLRTMGETITPVFSGKRGYLELLSFDEMKDRLYQLWENPIDPDEFPFVFQSTKWNIYGTENLRTQLQDLGLLNLHSINSKLLFDKNFEIEDFGKIKAINNSEKTI